MCDEERPDFLDAVGLLALVVVICIGFLYPN